MADGTVYTWGYNAHGELGEGTKGHQSIPKYVIDEQGNKLTGIIKISAGNYHIVVLKEDGTVWAWGINNNGQLGYGKMGTSSTNADYKKTVPTQVKLDAENDLTDIIDIGANYATSYALTSKRKSICMGTK